MERRRPWTLVLVALVAIALMLAPEFLDPTPLRMVARMAIFALFALSVNFLLGVAGIPSLGHGLFFGVGGYGIALAWLHFGYEPLLMLVAAPLLGAVTGAVTGLIVFRAKDLYFALITVGLSQMAWVLVVQWFSVTKGEDGIFGIELPSLLLDLGARYRFVVLIAIAAIVVMQILVASPFGTTLQAIRQNRSRVSFLAVVPRRYEFTSWVVSGAFASLSGALLVIFNQNAFPNFFHWSFSAIPLIMAIIGGTSYFFGPAVGAVFAVYVQDGVQAWDGRTNLVFGLAVLIIAVAGRDGVLGIGGGIAARVRQLFGTPRPVETG